MSKILYIAGWGRSGTTILDNLLGQAEGFVSTGELHQIWQRGLLENRPCGCGTPVRECAFWQEVFRVGFGGIDQVRAPAIIDSLRTLHTRHARRVLRANQRGDVFGVSSYAQTAARLYGSIATVSGARVIVDSSKQPTQAVLAAGLPGHEVYVVHMVRDPRAVAFSWQRRKVSPGKTRAGGLLTRVGPFRSTAVWVGYNAVISRVVRQAVGADRYRLVRYESFVSDPSSVVDELIDLVHERPRFRPEFDGHRVQLGMSHTAFGNPNRMNTGPIDIHLDDEWQTKMPRMRRSLVTALSYPLLRSMEYR